MGQRPMQVIFGYRQKIAGRMTLITLTPGITDAASAHCISWLTVLAGRPPAGSAATGPPIPGKELYKEPDRPAGAGARQGARGGRRHLDRGGVDGRGHEAGRAGRAAQLGHARQAQQAERGRQAAQVQLLGAEDEAALR